MGRLRLRSLKHWIALFLIGLGLTTSIAACVPAYGRNRAELTLVSFAVTRAAYENIIPQFVEKWRQEHNQDVKIYQSYGGSGAQTRAVIDGLDADVVGLALALDVKKIEAAELIAPGWEEEVPNRGIVTRSVAALVTRAGNPKGIRGWADLERDDVQVITANPKTSGGARWNFLGLWGSVTQSGGDPAAAMNFVSHVFTHSPVLPRDARESSDVFFNQEQGDVLINYENEVLLAKQRGEGLPFIVPDVNVSIENPVAVVDANVEKHGNRELAEAFVAFLFTPEAQREFAKTGFRPVHPEVAEAFAEQYPPVKTLFTVEDLGGWDTVQTQFFKDGGVFDQIQAQGSARS